MQLRRTTEEPIVQRSAADDGGSTAWDGVPMVAAARVVIRAARAGDLIARRQPVQVS